MTAMPPRGWKLEGDRILAEPGHTLIAKRTPAGLELWDKFGKTGVTLTPADLRAILGQPAEPTPPETSARD